MSAVAKEVLNASVVVENDEAHIVEYLLCAALRNTAAEHMHKFEKPGIRQLLGLEDFSAVFASKVELALRSASKTVSGTWCWGGA